MARVPNVTRESIPETQRAVFDEIVQERGEIPTVGPGSVMFNAPEVASRAVDLAVVAKLRSLEDGLKESATAATRDRYVQYHVRQIRFDINLICCYACVIMLV